MGMRYAVIGTGAVGGYYGGLLARAGLDVHFLLRSDYEHVREHGLRVESVDGDFDLPIVNACRHADEMPVCDVALVAIKTTQNASLSEILPRVVRPGGTVVVLQNGLGVEEDVARIVPEATVLGGLCFVCSQKAGPGHIRHLDYGLMTLGEYAPGYGRAGVTEGLVRLAETFEHAGIAVQISDNLGEARWRKLIWNIPFNGLTVVLNATTEQLIQDPASLRFAREIMIEVTETARGLGHAVGDEEIERMLGLTERMVAYKPSMKLDYDAGRPLEIQAIYWAPIAAAAKAGLTMPAVRTLALELEYLAQRA